MITTIVLVQADPKRIAECANTLAGIEGVAEVYSVAGDVDLIVIIRVRHHDALAEVVTGKIAALPGIVETRTMIAFKAFSQHDLDAMWSIGAE